MSILHKSSTIFIDFEDMLCDTDSYVCKQLYTSYKSSKPNDFIFKKLIDTIDHPEVGDENIKYLVMTKETDCFLEEYVDDGQLQSDEEHMNLSIIVNAIYSEILYNDNISDIGGQLSLTKIGDNMRYLIKDPNLKNIYIYMPSCTNAIHRFIFNQFTDLQEKITIITGDRESFIRSTPCELYIMKSIDYVPCLFFDRGIVSEIIIPSLPCNMEENGIRLRHHDDWEDAIVQYELTMNIANLLR